MDMSEPKYHLLTLFDKKRQNEAWISFFEFEGLQEFEKFLDSPDGANAIGKRAFEQLCELRKKVQDVANRDKADQPAVALDKAGRDLCLSLLSRKKNAAWAWTLAGAAEVSRSPKACFERLALLAAGGRGGRTLRLVEQGDQALMWKAPMVHPMQVRENAYQRFIREAVRYSGKTQAGELKKYFIQDEGAPAPLSQPKRNGTADRRLASVTMNHLIDGYYLLRLLVRYEAQSEKRIPDPERAELSSKLTHWLHNGDRSRMGWLTQWLTKAIVDLGSQIDELNPKGQGQKKKVIFYVKGGRALNFYLETPQNGQNDWDTQVVIDPNLPAQEWYELFARVHDKVLTFLQSYNRDFTKVVEGQLANFAGYLDAVGAPPTAEDDEPDENESDDTKSGYEHADCKAELIDIVVRRRDSAAGLEEWTRLSPPDALLTRDGVTYPSLPYYLNEYLMMIRHAFRGEDVAKAPKRIARFHTLLQHAEREPQSPAQARRLKALPKTAALIDNLKERSRQVLLRTIAAQFVEAYSLLQDQELAIVFDAAAAALIAAPEELPDNLGGEMKKTKTQEKWKNENYEIYERLAKDVGVAHTLSKLMRTHLGLRNNFFLDKNQRKTPDLEEMGLDPVADPKKLFDNLLIKLSSRISPVLREGAFRAQFAVTGDYAARLHADHLGAKGGELDNVRRIVVHLQCASGVPEDKVLAVVRGKITEVVQETPELEEIGLDPVVADPKSRSLAFRWKKPIRFGKGGQDYHPLVLKVRAAQQRSETLPVLASIGGIPVLDLRYLVDDYLRKAAKIEEDGARQDLASATSAVLDLMTQFDFTASEDPDELE
jgi:hypothetical protein